MDDWFRHTYRRRDTRLSVKEGTASLRNAVEADAINPVSIAGFSRPLPKEPPVDYEPLAEEIARKSHAGQLDRQGRPYVEHPARVAARMDTDEEKAVAWCHDVLEDTPMTAEDLLEAGLPAHIVRSIVALTKSPHQPNDLYYEGVAADPVALKVKTKGDIMDNLDPRRLLALDALTMVRLMQKYAHALDVLTGELIK